MVTVVRLLAPGALLLALSVPAHAGLLDKLNQAMEAAKKLPGATASAPQGAAPVPTAMAANPGSELIEPFSLAAYPRAELKTRYLNPLEATRIPLSRLEATPADGYQARRSVGIEGKVTMYGYDLRADESPLLVRRHYENLLLQDGFRILFECASNCGGDNYAWGKVLDTQRKLDSNYFPKNPDYLVAYKPGALVVVGVGTYINRYSAVVKVVEGRVLDPEVIDSLIAAQSAPPAASQIVPSTPGGNPPSAPLIRTGALPTCVAQVREQSVFPSWTVRNDCARPIAINYCWFDDGGAIGADWLNGANGCTRTGMVSSGTLAAGATYAFSRRPVSVNGQAAAKLQVGRVCDMSDARTRCE